MNNTIDRWLGWSKVNKTQKVSGYITFPSIDVVSNPSKDGTPYYWCKAYFSTGKYITFPHYDELLTVRSLVLSFPNPDGLTEPLNSFVRTERYNLSDTDPGYGFPQYAGEIIPPYFSLEFWKAAGEATSNNGITTFDILTSLVSSNNIESANYLVNFGVGLSLASLYQTSAALGAASSEPFIFNQGATPVGNQN